jgi:putative endopeptidase
MAESTLRRQMRTRLWSGLTIGFAIALAFTGRDVAGQRQPGAPNSASGIDLSAMDKSANACADFYQFACGAWIASHPLPPDRASYGRFTEVDDRNNEVLRDILEKTPVSGADPEIRKSVDYYASCIDEKRIDARGMAPLSADLARIASVATRARLAPVISALHAKGVPVFFGFGSSPDFKDASKVIAAADQGGLGLPDRDYYLKEDDHSKQLRQEYVGHVQHMLRLSGLSAAASAAGAQAVMQIETVMAKGALDRVSRREPANVYHKMALGDVRELTPIFDWPVYLRDLQAPPFDDMNVAEPEFMKAVNEILTKTPLRDLRAYMRWHLLNASAEFLPKAFVDENFAFTRILTGAKQLRPRWKRCVQYTDGDLGEAVGKAFVQRAFGGDAKARTLDMVHAIEQSMDQDLRSLTWMSEDTKKEAFVKLRAVANKIGYPDKWRDYSALRIVRGDAFGNSQRANAFQLHRQLAKIGKPVDKTEWEMTPPTVNAYYDPLENNINFPAGILQPPFYNNAADDAVNFGAVGAVVGHELTHGFDDEGRQFDEKGNLRDWWTEADAKAFEERAACIVNQYGGYPAVDDVKLNGKLTLGENTADNGGMRLAWMALQESVAKKPLGVVDGFTPEQRFFIGWAQIWCQNRTDEMARMLAATDPHSPGQYRVNGVVANFPEFQKAFNCPAGSPMVSASACRVW